MSKEQIKNARRQLIKKIGDEAYWELSFSKRSELVRQYFRKIYFGKPW